MSDLTGEDDARWIACEHPERPRDDHTSYHLDGCRGCVIAAQANVALGVSSPRILGVLSASLDPSVRHIGGSRQAADQ